MKTVWYFKKRQCIYVWLYTCYWSGHISSPQAQTDTHDLNKLTDRHALPGDVTDRRTDGASRQRSPWPLSPCLVWSRNPAVGQSVWRDQLTPLPPSTHFPNINLTVCPAVHLTACRGSSPGLSDKQCNSWETAETLQYTDEWVQRSWVLQFLRTWAFILKEMLLVNQLS